MTARHSARISFPSETAKTMLVLPTSIARSMRQILSEKHFAGGNRAHATGALPKQQGAPLVNAFEHATRLLFGQPRNDALAQTCRARQPRVTDRGEAFAAPSLIPFGEVGGEMKQSVAGLRWRGDQSGKRGRRVVGSLWMGDEIDAYPDRKPWRQFASLAGGFQKDAGDLLAVRQHVVRPLDAKVRSRGETREHVGRR